MGTNQRYLRYQNLLTCSDFICGVLEEKEAQLTKVATGSEVAMRSPFSRTFKWFLLWIGIETIGRYIDPNELINQRPILAIEKTFVPGDRPWTNEDLAYYLYDNAPTDYNRRTSTSRIRRQQEKG
ncbi:unnamed protein product [Oikopleura dioica]|uniref:Uncharacterized protein n=1 Tax=Oikopleura dioica TaxID=34765 RepID=E4XWS0_OIKDI|nr:unnamed protein product [Oikopleura dioica]